MSSHFELRERVKNLFKQLIRLASINLPRDVYDYLVEAYEHENNPLARKQLETIIANVKLARESRIPICQDTGTPYFYLEVGDEFPLKSELRELALEAVREATREIPLRPNAVDPFTNVNSGDNTGRHTPYIDVELIRGDELKAHFVAKGGGSEYPSTLAMIPPAEGVKGVKKVVLEAVLRAGPMPCPPVVVGVGVAAGADVALRLAKKALLRPLGVRHEDQVVARLEEELLNLINELGIGPHGFGGRYTALDVKIEYGYRHPASMAVGVTFACWALRRASGVVNSKGEVKILSKHI